MVNVRDDILKRQDPAALAATPPTSSRAPRQPQAQQLRNTSTRARVRKHAANFPPHGGPQPRQCVSSWREPLRAQSLTVRSDPRGSRYYQMGQYVHHRPRILKTSTIPRKLAR